MTTSNLTFQLYKATNGQWAWRLLAGNNRSIAWAGETYHNKADAANGISLVKKYAPTAPFGGAKFELFKATNGQWSWRLLADNGRSIAYAGETYHNQSDAEHGISLVKQAANAPVVELTPA